MTFFQIIALYLLFYIFIFFPILVIVHELGHVIAIKIFKGKIYAIHLTNGFPLFRFKKVYLGINFMNGHVDWENKTVPSFYKRAIISASGSLMVLLVGIIFSLLLIKGFFTPSMRWIVNTTHISLDMIAFLYIHIAGTIFLGALLPLIPNKGRSDGSHIIKHLQKKSF